MRIALTLIAGMALADCGSGVGVSGKGITSSTSSGTSSSGSDTGSSGTAQGQALGGLWRGPVTTASGAVVAAWVIVSEDGRFFGSADNTANDCADVIEGSLTSSAGTFSGVGNFGVIQFSTAPQMQSACTLSDGSVWGTSTLTGSIVQRSSLTWTVSDTTAAGTALAAENAKFAYDPVYNESADLTKIAGTWTGQTGSVFSLDSDGVLFSQDANTGCTINGQVSVIDAAYNAYSATISYSLCPDALASLNGVTAVGLMVLNDTVVPNGLLVGYTAVLPDGDTLMISDDATR